VINEITGKKTQSETLELKVNGTVYKNPEELSDIMASFFEAKIKGLVDRTGLPRIIIPEKPSSNHAFTSDELDLVIKTTKKKNPVVLMKYQWWLFWIFIKS